MKLSIGIVGLPNVGKSTLFNALLKKQIANVANYPFCTIEPNVGIIEVPDERLPIIAKIVNTTKIVPAVVEFYDIAGLVRGASKGEGLGNKFLSHIREVSAIVHVVRLFEDSNVVHVSDKINPLDDIQTIESELMLADLDTLQKQHEPKGSFASKDALFAYKTFKKVQEKLNQGIAVRNQELTTDEMTALKPLNLLTVKPVIFLFNLSEKQLENQEESKTQIVKLLNSYLATNNKTIDQWNNVLYLNAKLENEILVLPDNEQQEYLRQYNLEETGLNRLIKKAYETLGLISFLTGGTLEARAWTITKGTLAPQAASVIHTDFEKKFIKADIVKFEDFVKVNGWLGAREQGKVNTVGKDYVIEDGEVVEFKIGQ